MDIIPQKLASLQSTEEQLRQEARSMITADHRLQMHLAVTEAAMDMADTLRQFNSSDENLKVTVVLGMGTFNEFAASIKLTLSGYHQNSAFIPRDGDGNSLPTGLVRWRSIADRTLAGRRQKGAQERVLSGKGARGA